MKIVVPMAGMGKRLRPHTLTIPKPLVPIAGKPIVQRLVEDLANTCPEPIDEIAFVIGDFGEEVEQKLLSVARELGAKGSIHYQKEPLGTAHAILCAKEALQGKVMVAFADTLFRIDSSFDPAHDGVLWVRQIEDPSQFGVVQLNDSGAITDFVEKPSEFVSDLAMIGIYYFREGEILREELQYLIDNNVIKGGEYQLPDALLNMTKKGHRLVTEEVSEWLDCGNKNAVVHSNERVLANLHEDELISSRSVSKNSVIIPPCYIGPDAVIEESVIGPFVSIGSGSHVSRSLISHSIIQENSQVSGVNWKNSMVGNHVRWEERPGDLSAGDYTTMKSG